MSKIVLQRKTVRFFLSRRASSFFLKIALSLEKSSKFRRFIFVQIDRNGALVRSIREILRIYLQKSRSRSRRPQNFVDLSSQEGGPLGSVLV